MSGDNIYNDALILFGKSLDAQRVESILNGLAGLIDCSVSYDLTRQVHVSDRSEVCVSGFTFVGHVVPRTGYFEEGVASLSAFEGVYEHVKDDETSLASGIRFVIPPAAERTDFSESNLRLLDDVRSAVEQLVGELDS